MLSCGEPPVRAPAGPPCPLGTVWIGGGEATLGAFDPDHFEDQFVPVEVEVDGFCIAELPFPGRVGDPWFEDGIEAGLLDVWEVVLEDHGRRLCTVEELLWAAAAGPANLPWPTGTTWTRPCEPDTSWGDMDAIGHWEACRNAFGLRDFSVVSSWAVGSVDVDDARSAVRRRDRVVAGGTNRRDTFYAPNAFGLHGHDPGDPAFFDDQLRVCADPLAALDAEWLLFVEAAAMAGTFDSALELAPVDVEAPLRAVVLDVYAEAGL